MAIKFETNIMLTGSEVLVKSLPAFTFTAALVSSQLIAWVTGTLVTA